MAIAGDSVVTAGLSSRDFAGGWGDAFLDDRATGVEVQTTDRLRCGTDSVMATRRIFWNTGTRQRSRRQLDLAADRACGVGTIAVHFTGRHTYLERWVTEACLAVGFACTGSAYVCERARGTQAEVVHLATADLHCAGRACSTLALLLTWAGRLDTGKDRVGLACRGKLTTNLALTAVSEPWFAGSEALLRHGVTDTILTTVGDTRSTGISHLLARCGDRRTDLLEGGACGDHLADGSPAGRLRTIRVPTTIRTCACDAALCLLGTDAHGGATLGIRAVTMRFTRRLTTIARRTQEVHALVPKTERRVACVTVLFGTCCSGSTLLEEVGVGVQRDLADLTRVAILVITTTSTDRERRAA